MKVHVTRTKKAFGGMGSLNDVSISPTATHNISRDVETIRSVDRDLSLLRERLFEATNGLLTVLLAYGIDEKTQDS